MTLLLLWCCLQDPEAKAAAFVDEMRTEDITVRRKALDGILAIGKPAVPALLRALADETPGLKERVDGLVGKFSSKEWKERDEAMRSLVRLGRRAMDFLKSHVEETDAEVLWRVKTALAEIEEQRPRESQLDFVRNASLCLALGQIGEGAAVGPLLKELTRTQSGEVKLRAVEALALLRASVSDTQADEASEEAVKLLASSRDRRERTLLVRSLGRLRSRAAVQPLKSLLEKSERDVYLKRNAMQALVAIGDWSGVAAIVRCLESEDIYLRDATIEVLAPMAGGDQGFDALKEPKENAGALKKFHDWWAGKSGKLWED